MTDKKESSASDKTWSRIKPLAILFKEVGLPGFIFIMVFGILLIYGSSEQKRAFIDRFILLEKSDTVIEPCIVVIVILVGILLISSIYFTKTLALRKEENNRIGREKSELQAQLLKIPLHSSDEK